MIFNELLKKTVLNVLHIDNSGSIYEIANRNISSFYVLSVFKSNVIHGHRDNIAIETEIFLNNNSSVNNISNSKIDNLNATIL